MPTQFYFRRGGSNPTQHVVEESVQDVTDAVNAALSNDLKFVNFTNADDRKEFSVEARYVGGIKEV